MSAAQANDRALPHWLSGDDGRRTFAWTHLPTSTPRRRTSVQVIPPVGPEYLHSHRAVRHLARELARLGFVTVRHDPSGMGNSSADLLNPETFARWEEDCLLARRHLLTVPGVQEVAVVTLRSGSLVSQSLLAGNPSAAVVHWFPYLNGSAFVRDLSVIDAMLHLPAPDGPFIEGGGYPVHERTQAALDASNLLTGPLPHTGHALLVNDSALQVNDRLRKRLEERGIATERIERPGLSTMMRQAEVMEVPRESIVAITQWLARSLPAPASSDAAPVVQSLYEDTHVRERPLHVAGDRPMFGILTEPLRRHGDAPLFVLLNAGAAHHVGPNRLHVNLARELGARGVSSLRLDLSNLGESATGLTAAEHHPYAPTAAEDVISALAAVSRTTQHDRFVLCGLCSGAHNSFHAALAAPQGMIAGLILLNPLTFHWRAGDNVLNPEGTRSEKDAAQFHASARDPRKWARLLTDPRRLARVGMSAATIAWTRVRHRARGIGQRVGLGVMTQLERDLRRLLGGGTWISVLTAESEPGYAAIRSGAGRLLSDRPGAGRVRMEILPATDHTFSAYASRRGLIGRITTHFLEHGT